MRIKEPSAGRGCRCGRSCAGLESCVIAQSCCEQLFGLAPHHAGESSDRSHSMSHSKGLLHGVRSITISGVQFSLT